jgi:amino acid permease
VFFFADSSRILVDTNPPPAMADTLEPPSVPIDEGALEAAQQASEDPLREPLLPVAGGPAPGLLLLPGARLVDPAPDPQQLAAPRANLVASTVVLAKTIIGAGAAALPYAVARLGGLTAVAFLVAIAAMTHFSVPALTLGTLATGHASYPAVVQALLGPRAAAALDVALVLRCAGLIVVYLVLATDILAGGAGLPGLLCDLAGARGAGWCGRRRGVAAALAVGVLGPLVAPRRLAAARLSSAVGLGAAGAWAVVTVGLAGVAAASGAAHPLPWLPDARTLGGGSWGEQAVNLLATLPVIATAYTCQMTVHVIARDLEPFSQRRMRAVSAGAVTICTVFFLAVGIGSYVAFGADVPADVLEEFSERCAGGACMGSSADGPPRLPPAAPALLLASAPPRP